VKLGGRILLAVSLVANAVALYEWATVSPPEVETPSEVSVAMPTQRQQAEGIAVGDAHAYLQALLARGLTLEETKPLVLARLMVESARAGSSERADEYWRSGYALAAAEGLRSRVAAADHVRERLLELYGSGARTDAVFASLFEPLDGRYAFLAPEQRLVLQKLQLARQVQQAKGTPAKPAPVAATVTRQPASRMSATLEASQELRAALGADAALQYLYRFSPLADQLRAARLDLSGAEFRDAFATLLQFEAAAADPQAFTRTRAALRAALGDARFTRLWAARDPLFDAIAAAGGQQGLADAGILAAYAVFNDAQDGLAATVNRFASVDPQRAAAELMRIQQDLQQRVASVVGQDAAEALVRAAAHFSVSMQQTSTHLRE